MFNFPLRGTEFKLFTGKCGPSKIFSSKKQTHTAGPDYTAKETVLYNSKPCTKKDDCYGQRRITLSYY